MVREPHLHNPSFGRRPVLFRNGPIRQAPSCPRLPDLDGIVNQRGRFLPHASVRETRPSLVALVCLRRAHHPALSPLRLSSAASADTTTQPTQLPPRLLRTSNAPRLAWHVIEIAHEQTSTLLHEEILGLSQLHAESLGRLNPVHPNVRPALRVHLVLQDHTYAPLRKPFARHNCRLLTRN